MDMKVISHFCIGESHKATDKPCQDYSYAEQNDTLSMAIVCDGHGGERYFRSQYGAEFAANITKDAIKSFVENMSQSSWCGNRSSVFENAPFTGYSSADSSEQQASSNAHKALQWLFASIISQWNQKIAEHALLNDLNEWEQAHVEEKYREEFIAKRSLPDATFEKTYGCTLMAYVQTPSYWFAFHLGDGKCVMFTTVDEQLKAEQPIPWDERCFLNKTTSICDSQALDEFRYCYQGDGTFPLAVFLGSDGIDDSYGDGDNLTNFYIEIYKLLLKKDYPRALKEIKKVLPVISARGSKDDMSIAVVFDDHNPGKIFDILTEYQRQRLDDQMTAAIHKLEQLNAKVESFGDPQSLDSSALINLNYAQKDIEKVQKQIERVKKRKSVLKGEVTSFNKKHK